MLRNFSPLEIAMYKRSMQILFNSANGALVVDDELVVSRAQDVESKSFLNRKTEKDGPVVDCLADSTICLMLGMCAGYYTFDVCHFLLHLVI